MHQQCFEVILNTPMAEEYVALAEQLQTLLNGNSAAIGGIESYLDAVNEGAAELAEGAATLQNSYDQFDSAIGTLADTLTELLYEMTELKDGVNALVSAYSELDSGLNAYTEGVAQVAALPVWFLAAHPWSPGATPYMTAR